MKTEEEILKQISKKVPVLQDLEKQHKELCQIDMLSGEGSTLRRKINNIKGIISALAWTLGGDNELIDIK